MNINQLNDKIAAIETEIKQVNVSIGVAEEKMNEPGLDVYMMQFWAEEKNKLREEKNKLREEKNKLLDRLAFKEQELRASQAASVVVRAFPALGQRELSTSKPTTRHESAYKLQIQAQQSEFGILDDFKIEKLNQQSSSLLWTEANQESSGSLGVWSGENGIQNWVRNAIRDCLTAAELINRLNVHTETTFSISRLMSKHQNRADITALVNDTKSIAGVCEVKLPGFDMKELYQIVDYMVDLRNSFNVRFVFGILTTYNEWRVLWFDDTNVAAQTTSKEEYDELCNSGTANDYSISNSVKVHMTRVYKHSETPLIELLASLMYKIFKTPIATPDAFAEPHKKYVCAKKDSFTYESLPAGLLDRRMKPFKYEMPDARSQNFYILQYYHRGGDGRVALCCSSSGNLCVLKFLLDKDNEEAKLLEEARIWNLLWDTKCRVVATVNRHALLMPFCFHVRVINGSPVFCPFSAWNKRLRLDQVPIFNDNEVVEFDKLNMKEYEDYRQQHINVLDVALRKMIQHRKHHDDLKWEHLALWPKYNETTDKYDLHPILLDLTRTKDFPQDMDVNEDVLVQEAKNKLQAMLE